MIAADDLFIDGPAGALAVRTKGPAGATQALVLVQGSNLSGQGMFDVAFEDYSLMDAFAFAGFAAITFSIRGYSRSELAADPFSVTTDAAMEDLDAVMEWAATQGFARPHLFGFSWGGRIAGRWAETNAERIDRLVLADPARGGGGLVLPAPGPDDGWWINAPNSYAEKMEPQFTDPAFAAAVAGYVEANEPRSPNGVRRENATYVTPVEPTRITRPTLLIYGIEAAKAAYMQGGLERADFFERLATDDKAFVLVPGGGDFVHWQAGRRLFHRRVIEFLTL